MRNAAYLFLDVGAIATAVGIGLWRSQNWIASWRKTLLAIGISMAPFVAWDVCATAAGHWSFNPAFTLGATVALLPIEELLFFIVIPLVTLCVWELCAPMTGKSRVFTAIQWTIVAAAAILAAANLTHVYSLLAAASACLVAIGWLWRPYGAARWGAFVAIMFVLFLAANTVLTALPIVQYNPAQYSGVRIGTIPVEDFFYNFALVGACVLAYGHISRRIRPN